MKRILLLLLLCASSGLLWAQVPKVSSGRIERIANFTSKWVQSRDIDVWLPDGYPAAGKYAVLYMHDGQMLFDSTTTWNRQEWRVDETAGRLQREGRTLPFIVVAVPNSGQWRFSEYFPLKAEKLMPRGPIDSLHAELQGRYLADNYLRFLVQELKPHIDKHFTTYTDAAHTFLVGSSMGGLISLYGMCEYPKVFGGAACLSTHWPGSLKHFSGPETYFQYLWLYFDSKLPRPKNHLLYMDRGDRTLDSFYAPFQPIIDRAANKKGYKEPRFTSRLFPGADHSEKAWAARLEEPLLFLLGKEKKRQ